MMGQQNTELQLLMYTACLIEALLAVIFKADAEPAMRSRKADTFLHGLSCIWWLHIDLGACQQEAACHAQTYNGQKLAYLHACLLHEDGSEPGSLRQAAQGAPHCL